MRQGIEIALIGVAVGAALTALWSPMVLVGLACVVLALILQVGRHRARDTDQ